ncbi:MAG: NAD-dependent epimerase/dehydratase family protein, partial [Bacteroidales bacterium]|nr:NAD-dependent epimerase/dehydratase family protein [Bacteroidales bacterium]
MQNNKSEIKNSKVLITGGAGFIGSNLIEKLLRQNNYIVCLDNFSTGKKENINQFIENKNFKLINADIRDLTACKNACERIDIVLHHAALGS